MEDRTHREKRKEDITSIAWKLFLEHGYRDTTMSDIADAADLSRKTLYQYFKSKEEIALEIEIHVFENFIELMEEHFPKMKGSGYEKLAQYFEIIDAILDKYRDAIQFTGLFDFHIKDKYIIEPPVEKFLQLIAKSSTYLRDIIEAGIQDGSLKETLNPELAAETINDSWLYLAQRVFSRPDNINKFKEVISRQEISYQMMLFEEALKK